METVREVDLVDGAIGSSSGIGEGIGHRCHGQHPPAPGDEALAGTRGPGVEDSDSRNLLGRFDLPNETAAFWSAGISLRGYDDRDCRLLRKRGPHVGQPPCGHREQQFGEVAFDAQHDCFAFGVPEADIVLDQLRAIGGQHQPRVEHAGEGCSGSRHCPGGRQDYLLHRPALEFRRENRRRRISAHPARIRPGVAFAHTLVILGRGERDGRLAINQREQARFLSLKEFLDDQWAVTRGVDGGFGLVARHSDRHALAGSEAVRLDDDGNRELLQRVTGRRRSIRPDVSGSGNAVPGT